MAAPKGDYAALFKGDDAPKRVPEEANGDPLAELNALIAEMVAAAQGEDHVRGWARRLSRILKALQDLAAASRQQFVQERLL